MTAGRRAFERGNAAEALAQYEQAYQYRPTAEAQKWKYNCQRIKDSPGTYLIRAARRGDKIPADERRFLEPSLGTSMICPIPKTTQTFGQSEICLRPVFGNWITEQWTLIRLSRLKINILCKNHFCSSYCSGQYLYSSSSPKTSPSASPIWRKSDRARSSGVKTYFHFIIKFE